MATKTRINLKDLYKMPAGAGGKKSRLEALIDEGRFELTLIDALESGKKVKVKDKGKWVEKEAKIVPQRDWFTENGDGTYSVKIGRANYALTGKPKERMIVKDRAQLRAVIEQIIDDAENDEEFKKFITDYAAPKTA